MAEPIKMPFEMWNWVGPTNHALDAVQGRSAVSCAKTAKPDREIPFELRAPVDPVNHGFRWGPDHPWERGGLKGVKGQPVVKYSVSPP